MTTTGLGSVLAFGAESTWGTEATASLRLPFMSESMGATFERVQSSSLAAGNRFLAKSARRPGRTSVGGTVELQLFDRGMGMLFEAMMGTRTTTADTPSAGLNTHVFTPGDLPEGLSVFVGIGGDTGVPTKAVAGGRVNGFSLGCRVGEEAKLSIDLVAKSLDTDNAGTVGGTEPADLSPMSFLDVSTLTLADGAIGCVQDISLTVAHNMIGPERNCLGDATPKQGVETRRELTGSMTVDFEGWGLHDLVESAALGDLVLAFAQPGADESVTITCQVQLDGATATVNDEGVISVPYTFMALGDAGDDSRALTIALVNGDAA